MQEFFSDPQESIKSSEYGTDNRCYDILTPWESNPFQLISWWDMEQFTLNRFYNIAQLLERIKQDYLQTVEVFTLAEKKKIAYELEKRNITVQERSSLADALGFVQKQCQQIALRNSAEAISEFRTELVNWKMEEFNKITANQVAMRLQDIDRNIRREMRLHLFMYIPNERAEYYQSWGEGKRIGRGEEIPLFGNAVNEKFLSIDYDVNEAGNCFAAGRYTACVFHLMRVLEIGLAAFAKVFSVPADHTNWQNIIESIEKKIRAIGSEPKKSVNRKEELEFYAQVANHFMFLKDAWRNYTAHARGKYTEEEAKLIIENTRAFMQKLATRLSE